jgi:Recombination endonuclease VII
MATNAERQAAYRERRKQGVELRHRRLVAAEGRECAYSGNGNCGHAFKEWHEFGPGTGPHGKERRCKACMVVKATEYLKREPTPVQQRRNTRQKTYQQTEAGKDVGRRAKIKYRYGITADQYDLLHEQQGGCCYFCGFIETVIHHATHEVMRLSVDHDHTCDQGHDPKRGCPACIRGLACYNCNIFIERAERSTLLRPRIEDLLARRPLQAVTPGS